MIETPTEFRIGAAQRIFRIGFDMPANIDEGKDQIAEFVRNFLRFPLRQRLTQFGDFLLDLVENGSGI
ncbi:hypothetical protein D3C86_1825520 [compost metagenome]